MVYIINQTACFHIPASISDRKAESKYSTP